MASTKQTTQSWKQLNTTATHKSHRRREKPHSPPSTCSINPCYQKSPSPRANCTPASWPSSQPKTAKLVTSSSDPAQCGHHTLGRVYPVANMSVIYCTYLLRHDTVLYHAEIAVPTRGLIWIFFVICFRGRKCPVFGVLILWCIYDLQRYCCQGNFDLL